MLIFWIIATFAAFYIKGLCGFANTLIFQTVMGFEANNISISPVELVLGYPANIIMAIKERKSIQWKSCLILTGLLVCGALPGILILKTADPRPVKIICGIVVALAGLEMFLRDTKPSKMAKSKAMTIVIGVTAGILCGLYGIGVILGAYLSRVSENQSEFKGTMSFIFAIENTLRILSYLYLGIVTLASIKQSIFLMPVMLLALFLGMFSSNFLDEKKAKKLVTILLIISGIALVITNL